MATTYAFAGTNTTASTATLAPIKLGLATNYGESVPKNSTRTPGVIYLKNGTTGTNIDELVKVKCKPVSSVQNLKIPVRYPVPVKDGVMIEAEIQNILRETRDDGTIFDHPAIAKLSVVTDVSAPFYDFTALQHSFVEELVLRLLGALHHNDGTERYVEYAQGLIKPSAD